VLTLLSGGEKETPSEL